MWQKIFNEFFNGPGRLIKSQSGKDPVKQFRAVVVGAVGRRYKSMNHAGHSTSADPGAKEDLTPVDSLVKTIHEGLANAASATVLDDDDDDRADKTRAKNRVSNRSDALTAVGLDSAPVLDVATAPSLASTAASSAAKTSALSKSGGKGGKKRGATMTKIVGAKRSKLLSDGDDAIGGESDEEPRSAPGTMSAIMAKLMESKGGGGGVDITGLLSEKKIDREEREKREVAREKAKNDRAKAKHMISERKMDLAEKKEERKKKSIEMKAAIKMRESIVKQKMDWYAMQSGGKITEAQLEKEIKKLDDKLEQLDD